MPEEQIRCRGVSPATVLTVGLMRTRVNYSIFRIAPLPDDGLQIAISRAHGLAVKTYEGG